MPLKIIRNDITTMKVDAIVNAANSSLLGGGGVDGAIHRAAGEGLLKECITLGGCKTGEAKITNGYDLPAKYVIHTVGPVYQDGNHGEKALLKSCYMESLRLAKQYHCESVAFPLISSGVYGYPKSLALKVAVDVISDFLLENEMTVYLVVYDAAMYHIGEKLFADITSYIDDHYVLKHSDTPIKRELAVRKVEDCIYASASMADIDLKLGQLDESFSEMLMRLIDERKMTDAQCYKKANIDRKLFSKIRSDVHYRPSKSTALAFAIALELSLSETEQFLRTAGFALSHSNQFDIIIEYFITKGIYNIFEINEALFAFDQSTLGA